MNNLNIFGYIYKVTNKTNNKCYIGQTIKSNPEHRWIEHISKAKKPKLYKTKFLTALRKYGENGFVWEVIDNALTEQELNDLEVFYIDKFNSVDNGYNILRGGANAPLRNKNVANKVSISLIKQFNPERKCWQSRIKYNKKVTSLGLYNDPLSAEIVYKITQKEIFGGGDVNGAY